MNAPRSRAATTTRRVAIYTRKSTSKGLEQEFSSLDAQREACERYIAAQAHNGWTALPTEFSDGGFTGANLDRPGFKALMTAIEAGQVDVVVVYKVDRLSRSLLDFAQLMATFDRHGVAFVSVTQNFSTADAMGRLTLNLLMSFAEFEREMIAERTRDKIMAARRRGKWTGGPIPFGYRSVDTKLEVVEAEAEVVVALFETYLSVRSARDTAQALNKAGRRRRGGKRWSKAAVLAVLKDPLVRGLIRAGDELVDAEHDAIVGPEVYERADLVLDTHSRSNGPKVRNPAYLLTGLLTCACCGGAYTPGSASSRGRRYRYYRCVTRDKVGKDACEAGALPADAVEDFVVAQVRAVAQDPEVVEGVVADLHGRIAAERARLRTEQAALPGAIADRSGECQRLLDTMDRLTGAARGAIEERLQAVATARHEAEERLVEVERRLLTLEDAETDAGWVQQALERFEDLWGVMTTENRGRLLRALVASVQVHEPTGEITVELHRLDEPLPGAGDGEAP